MQKSKGNGGQGKKISGNKNTKRKKKNNQNKLDTRKETGKRTNIKNSEKVNGRKKKRNKGRKKNQTKEKMKNLGKGKGKHNGQRKGYKKVSEKEEVKCTKLIKEQVNGTCIESAVSYLNMISTVVANFEKQSKRMTKQNKTGGNKSSKKGLFKSIVDRLIQAGGENKSALSCGGQRATPGALQLKNLTAKFDECESKINESCNPANFPQPDKSRLEACSEATKSFSSIVKSCSKKKDTAACSCWLDPTLDTTAKEVKTCSFKTEADAIAKQLKACKEAFRTCRKYEDDAIKSLSACSKSTDKLKETAKQLGENKAALVNAQAKVDALITASERQQRQASSCLHIVQMVSLLITIVDQNTASPKVKVLSINIFSVTEVTCSDDETSQLKGQKEALKASVALVEISYETTLDEIRSKTLFF